MIRHIGKGFRIFSDWMSTYENLVAVYAALGIVVTICGILMVPMLSYHEDQIYSKTMNRTSTLDPYDRGGVPFTMAEIYLGTTPATLIVPAGSRTFSFHKEGYLNKNVNVMIRPNEIKLIPQVMLKEVS